MADISQNNWVETDASNTTAPPDGAPEGMNPSAVNDWMRMAMGALKRWYDWRIPVTTSGTSAAYTVSYSVTPTALADGMTHRVMFNAANTLSSSETTLNVNSLGAKNIRKFSAGSWVALAAGDLKANSVHDLSYHSADSTYRIVSSALADLAATGGNNTYTGTNDFTGGRAEVPTRPVADNGTDAASTAFVNRMLRSYLAGLGTSNNSGTPNSKIDVAAGVCMDDTNASLLVLSATTLDCGATGANGLDTGSLATSTSYHLHVIGKTDGTTALLACTTANLSSITMPSGYTLKRRIASFTTDASAHIIAYLQVGDTFYRKDITETTPGSSGVTFTLSVPTGISVRPLVQVLQVANSGGFGSVFYAPVSNQALTWQVAATSGGGGSSSGYVIGPATNTSGQVWYVATVGGAGLSLLSIFTGGWVDSRGRDA